MNRTSITSQESVIGNVESTALPNDTLSYGEPTRSTIMEHLEFEEYNDKRSFDCTYFVPTTIPMSKSKLALGDETSLMALSATFFDQLPQVQMQPVGMEISCSLAFEQLCHNQPSYNISLPQMNVPPPSHSSKASHSVQVSAIQVSEPAQVKQLSAVYPNKKHGSPVTIQKMMLMSEPYTYYQESLQSSHRPVEGVPTSAVNTSKSSTVSCKMGPSSGTSPDVPPVLHLHKEPVAVTFPARMSCVISSRPDRPGNRKLNFLRKLLPTTLLRRIFLLRN